MLSARVGAVVVIQPAVPPLHRPLDGTRKRRRDDIVFQHALERNHPCRQKCSLGIKTPKSFGCQFKQKAAQIGASGLLQVFHAGLPVAKPQLYQEEGDPATTRVTSGHMR